MRISVSLLMILSGVIMFSGCGSSKKDSDTTTTTNVQSLTLVPDTDTMVASNSSTTSLLTTGTPPFVKDITPDNMATYFTGNVTTLLSQIEAARSSRNWDSVKTLVQTFYEGNAKCQVIEQTSRILTKLRGETSDLCMLKGLGKETGLFTVRSGTAIEEGMFFTPVEKDVVRKFDTGDRSHVFQIQGTSTEANVYQLTMTSCLNTTALRAFRVRVDNAARTLKITVAAKANDRGVTTNQASFELTGGIKKDGDSYVADTAVAREVTASGKGSFTNGGNTNSFAENGKLTISGDVMTAITMTRNTGGSSANPFNNLMRNAISVQFNGTGINDLVVYQGAGKNRSVMTGTHNGNSISQDRTQSIGFDFNNTVSPQYTTVSTGTYVDNVAAVNFATDSILSQTAPADPVLTLASDANCQLTADSVIGMAQGSFAKMAAISAECNTNKIGESQSRLCQTLREGENAVQFAIKDRKDTGGKTDGLTLQE